MDISHINYLAVIVSTILTFVIGFLWYGPFFGKAWMKEIGHTEENAKKANMGKVFVTAFILTFIMSWNLAAFIGPKSDFIFGLFAGLAAGIGWVAASIGVVYLFSQKSLRLFIIDAGYQVIIYAMMGGILGAWK